jgi:AcrR family transcriptional regulator
MKDREGKIAAAGYDVISQYGVRRVTMADVAEAAGVSRQTVYNVFPNREALLAAVVRYHFNSKWSAIRDCITPDLDRKQRFQALLDILVIESWHSLQAMPHADELEFEIATTIKDEIGEIHAEARRNICEFLLPYQDALNSHDMTANGLGDLLHHSIMGLKLGSTTLEEIKCVTAAMLACLMAVTEPRH